MINAGQMETIPLSSDSESGNDGQTKPVSYSVAEESFNSASQIISMGERANSAGGSKSDGKGTLGPTPDLIPRTDQDANVGGRGRISLSSVNEHTTSSTDGETRLYGTEENEDEADEEKQRLIAQVLELQHTLEELSSRVDSVKEENLKLRSENQILGQYIENLMAASSVFQSSTPRMRRKASSGQSAASKSAAAKLQHQ